MGWNEADTVRMRRCIALAAQGLGETAPNPLVGCVIVKNEVIIGEGYHRRYGDRHAEVNAMNSVQNPIDLIGSTLYVNLEPCNHHGKTPPCTEAIRKAGIAKVVVANVDPNPLVSGSGIRYLRHKGLEVVVGVCQVEAAYLNRRFMVYHERKRPYVVLKWAQSSDGFIAPDDSLRNAAPQPHWISGETSRLLVQKWRGEEQSILVGRKTVERDDPSLTCRFPGGKNPIRIVVDPSLKLELSKKIFTSPGTVIVLNRKKSVNIGNVNYVKLEQSTAQSVLKAQYDLNIQSILVEGGAQTLSLFLREHAWDECRVFTSPNPLISGIQAPRIIQKSDETLDVGTDRLELFLNKHAI